MDRITNHSEQAVERLISQYRQNLDFIGILSAFCAQIQELENGIFTLYSRLDLSSVTGIQLDNLGTIIGVRRQGFNDEIYRTMLWAKLFSNISNGTPNEIINIFKVLTKSTNIDFIEIYPATIQIQGNANIDQSIEPYINPILQKALGAGVQINGLVLYEDESFVFDDDTDPVAEGDGFGDDTDLTVGGKLGWDI